MKKVKIIMQSITSSVGKVLVNGKEAYSYKGKLYPTQFKWFLVLRILLDRGYKLKCHYWNGDVRDRPDKFSMDSENGVAPVMPRRVEIFRETLKRDDLSSLFGLRVEHEKVFEIEDMKSLDPSVNESLNLIELVF